MTKYEYKCVRIKRNGLCKLIMNVCKKNVVLPREWAGIVVGIWSHHGMPRFECFSCSETAFVDYGGVVKVNGMVNPWDHAWFAILEPLAAVITFLKAPELRTMHGPMTIPLTLTTPP